LPWLLLPLLPLLLPLPALPAAENTESPLFFSMSATISVLFFAILAATLLHITSCNRADQGA